MFRALIASVLALAYVGFVSAPLFAEEKEAKEVTLEGKITCPKCDLGTESKCGTVMKTKDGKIYYFDADSNKKYHKDICTESRKGSVTGTVKKDGEKMIISVKELKYDK